MQDNLAPVDLVDRSQAIEAIANGQPQTVIILDFDETLLLRNSTAEYINSLRPRFLGFVLISLIRIIKPWAWLPKPFRGEQVRDWFLVVIPTLLLPWTLWLWRKESLKLAEDYGNTELIAAVRQNNESPLIIASLGFKFIIKPILQHLPIRANTLIGCRFWQGAGDRTQGKLAMMQSSLSPAEISSAVVVTDSQDDLPLLRVVAYPCFVIWSLAKYVNPFEDFWLYSLLKKIKG